MWTILHLAIDQHASIMQHIKMKPTVNQELHGYSIDVTVSCITTAPDPARDYWSEPGRNIIQRCTIIQSFTNKLISGLSRKYNLMITVSDGAL